jgi:hypothetical protein
MYNIHELYETIDYKNKIFGVKIDETNPHPDARVEYTDDAIGMIPMRGNDGDFFWGSWKKVFESFGIKPCIVNPDGTVAVYLDPNDYTKNIDGDAVNITGSGETGAGENVCVEFPTIWYKMWKNGTDQYMQFSLSEQAGFLALAHTRDPLYGTVGEGELSTSAVVRNKIYVSAYNGFTVGSAQRSLSGKTPTASITHPVAQTRCRANGTGWEMTTIHVRNLISVLFSVFFKSTDSQTALGKGATDTTVKSTGTRNASGMFYGSTNAAEVLKFCGIEAPFDNLRDWVEGLYSTIGTDPPDLGARKLCIATDDFDTLAYSWDGFNMTDVNPTPDNWKVLGTGFLVNQDGYIKTIHGSTEIGIISAAVGGGSSSTHYCDYGYLRAGCLASAGGRYADGADAGAFYVSVGSTAAYSSATFGARAMFIEPIV